MRPQLPATQQILASGKHPKMSDPSPLVFALCTTIDRFYEREPDLLVSDCPGGSRQRSTLKKRLSEYCCLLSLDRLDFSGIAVFLTQTPSPNRTKAATWRPLSYLDLAFE